MRILAAALLAFGCTHSQRIGPDMVSIQCKKTLGRCYERAQRECPYGFDLVDRANDTGITASRVGSMVMVTPNGGGEIIVRCRAPTAVSNPYDL